MAFDWVRAIERNRDDLIGIVTTLFVMAGIRTGVVAGTLPRSLHLRILALLRPAEYAARRLILMAACKLEWTIRLSPERAAGGTASGTAVGAARADGRPRAARDDDAPPAFALFDPFKRCGHPWLEPEDIAALDDDDTAALPPDEPVGAARLCGRIRALEQALQNLEDAALRLARWRARRHRDTCRPRRWGVLRPGTPPGWRRRPKSAVEAVARECHILALDAWNTS